MTVRFGPVEEQHALRRLPIEAASPAVARRFTVDALSAWGLHDLRDVAELLVSELVTNAVRYGRSGCILELTASPTAFRAAVSDDGDGDPEVQHPSPEDVSGRGLAIVEALASRWGVDATPAGKVVWFELHPQTLAPSSR